MKLSIDYSVDIGGVGITSDDLIGRVDTYRGQLEGPSSIEGSIRVVVDGVTQDLAFCDPLVRLIDEFLRRIPWVIGGDTETVALRNSAQCFAFTPTGAGDSVELSFFNGTETAIEDHVIEPCMVHMDAFVTQVLGLGERMVTLIQKLHGEWLTSDDDCRALTESLGDARRAWKEHQRGPWR